MFTKKRYSRNEAETFTHVSKDGRKYAQDLWNKFNRDLFARGLKLHYDAEMGRFFVASTELVPAYDGESGALNGEELEQVIEEGGFDSRALNNPPWFTSPSEYTLKPKA